MHLQGGRPRNPIRRSGGAYGLLVRSGDLKYRSPTFKNKGVPKQCEPTLSERPSVVPLKAASL